MGKIDNLFLDLRKVSTKKGRQIIDELASELSKELEVIKRLVIIKNIRDKLNI